MAFITWPYSLPSSTLEPAMNTMNLKRHRLTDSENRGAQLIAISKPGFFYYLLMLLIPLVFFLLDGIGVLTQLDYTDANDISQAVFATIAFFLTPGLMWLFRVETKIYDNYVLKRYLSLNRERVYYFKDLKHWHILGEQPIGMASHPFITMKFPEKKVRLYELGTQNFDGLKHFLKNSHPDKFKMPFQ